MTLLCLGVNPFRSAQLNTPNVVAQCRGCLGRAGSARHRPNGRS